MHDRKREEVNDVSQRQLAAKIGAYKELCGGCLKLRQARVYTEDALGKVDKILMINPEFYTMWNYRREILGALMAAARRVMVRGPHGECEGVAYSPAEVAARFALRELQFNAAVIEKRDHKSYCVWHHRRWALALLESSPELQLQQLKTEVTLCGRLLKADDRNFHCWGHRMQAVAQLRSRGAFSDADEMAFTRERVEANFSNYSAYHARAKVLMAADPAARAGLIAEEMEMVQNAFYTEPHDQSGWMYAFWLADQEPPGEGAAAAVTTESAAELLDDDDGLKWPRLALLRHGRCSTPRQDLAKLQQHDPSRSGFYEATAAGYPG